MCSDIECLLVFHTESPELNPQHYRQLGVAGHACNPSTLGVRQQNQKFKKKNAGIRACLPEDLTWSDVVSRVCHLELEEGTSFSCNVSPHCLVKSSLASLSSCLSSRFGLWPSRKAHFSVIPFVTWNLCICVGYIYDWGLQRS